MITPYSKIPQAGRRDWAGDLTRVLRHLITAVIILGSVDLLLIAAVIWLVMR